MDEIVRTKEVTLPNGEVVTIPVVLDEEWFTHNKTGYLDPRMLAPNDRQPRKYMDPVELVELKENIKQIGVREAILVTPMKYAPWAETKPEYKNCPFLITSGHRRTSSACEAGIVAVPVTVRVYNSQEAFLDDSSILNKHRANLSELEEGYELKYRTERGEKISHLVISEGRSFQHLKKRIALTYLAPDLQELISPKLTTRQRLAIGLSAALGDKESPTLDALQEKADSFKIPVSVLGPANTYPGELNELSDDERRFCLQRLYLKYIQKNKWGGVDGEKFVRTGKVPERKTGLVNGAGPREVQQEKKETVREQMIRWCKGVNNTNFMEMTPQQLRDAFRYAVREDLEIMVNMMSAASQDLQGMIKILDKLAKEKPVTRKEVLELSERTEQKVV